MIDTIYVERAVLDHERSRQVTARLATAQVLEIDHYGEVFNARRQNFRLQKRSPALILARREGELLQQVPSGFGLGPGPAWYWSHLLNCPYDCSYCFLQGMFRSAHFVLFVDYEAFGREIVRRVEAWHDSEEAGDGEVAARRGVPWFFSGYDCDSLALDGLTQFASPTLDLFESLPGARLELRTKSVQLQALLAREVLPNVVVAFSLSPSELADRQERGAPSIERRLRAAARLAARGWLIGWRFDPVVWFDGAPAAYARLVEDVAGAVPGSAVHSVTVGSLRLPKEFHRNMVRLLPTDPLIASLRRVESADRGQTPAGPSAPAVHYGYEEEVRERLLGPVVEASRRLWGGDRVFAAGEEI